MVGCRHGPARPRGMWYAGGGGGSIVEMVDADSIRRVV
jgi:hypothetical protein